MTRFLNARRVLRTKIGPWALWLATMGTAAVLYMDVGDRGPVLGFAHAPEYRVAPVGSGRIVSLAVELGQAVEAGDVIATMEGGAIAAELAIEEAEKARVQAAILAQKSDVALREGRLVRSLVTGVEEAERELLAAQARGKAKSAELRALKVQRRELKKLVGARMASQAELAALEVRHAALKQEAAAGVQTLALLEQQLSAAKERQGDVPTNSAAVAAGPLERELEVIDRRLQHLRAQRKELVLRAPSSGRVASVFRRAGEVAQAGEAVVSIVAASSDRVVACLSENQAMTVEVGTKAELWPRGLSGPALEGRVVSLGPIVDVVPVRCRRSPAQPAWGRDVVVLLDEPTPLVPGQAFNVRLEQRERPSGAVAAPPALGNDAPRPIMVPEALSRVSRFEPSGLVWVPGMARYVTVSDDTGLKDGDQEHAPWLFGLDASGRLDPRPIPIYGVDEVNDLESIVRLDNGSVFVLASQSYSKKGKRKGSRQAFLRLVPEQAGFRASHGLTFAERLDDADASFLEGLGITDTKSLDIEGMTAHQGGVLLGLKAPLSAKGHALVWHLKDPRALLDGASLKDAGLTLWAEVPLTVTADGREVGGGISELLSLPSGALLIAATASGIKTKRQSGSLWIAGQPAPGTLQVRRVRVFDNLKPEGLALAPTPGFIRVVFDTGAQTPLWLV